MPSIFFRSSGLTSAADSSFAGSSTTAGADSFAFGVSSTTSSTFSASAATEDSSAFTVSSTGAAADSSTVSVDSSTFAGSSSFAVLTEKKKQFYQKLPQKFSRQEALKIGERLRMKPRTVDRHLRVYFKDFLKQTGKRELYEKKMDHQ